jgi:hypothetical protein
VLSSAQDVLITDGMGFAAAVDVFDDSAIRRLAEAVHATHPVHRVATVSERLLAPASFLRNTFSAPGDTARQVARSVGRDDSWNQAASEDTRSLQLIRGGPA